MCALTLNYNRLTLFCFIRHVQNDSELGPYDRSRSVRLVRNDTKLRNSPLKHTHLRAYLQRNKTMTVRLVRAPLVKTLSYHLVVFAPICHGETEKILAPPLASCTPARPLQHSLPRLAVYNFERPVRPSRKSTPCFGAQPHSAQRHMPFTARPDHCISSAAPCRQLTCLAFGVSPIS